MELIEKGLSSVVRMSVGEAKTVCRLGQGEECCAFFAAGPEGFECVRMDPSYSAQIFARLEAGTMNAKGQGGWEGCYWQGQI